jgi:hypothetical protein
LAHLPNRVNLRSLHLLDVWGWWDLLPWKPYVESVFSGEKFAPVERLYVDKLSADDVRKKQHQWAAHWHNQRSGKGSGPVRHLTEYTPIPRPWRFYRVPLVYPLLDHKLDYNLLSLQQPVEVTLGAVKNFRALVDVTSPDGRYRSQTVLVHQKGEWPENWRTNRKMRDLEAHLKMYRHGSRGRGSEVSDIQVEKMPVSVLAHTQWLLENESDYQHFWFEGKRVRQVRTLQRFIYPASEIPLFKYTRPSSRWAGLSFWPEQDTALNYRLYNVRVGWRL